MDLTLQDSFLLTDSVIVTLSTTEVRLQKFNILVAPKVTSEVRLQKFNILVAPKVISEVRLQRFAILIAVSSVIKLQLQDSYQLSDGSYSEVSYSFLPIDLELSDYYITTDYINFTTSIFNPLEDQFGFQSNLEFLLAETINLDIIDDIYLLDDSLEFGLYVTIFENLVDEFTVFDDDFNFIIGIGINFEDQMELSDLFQSLIAYGISVEDYLEYFEQFSTNSFLNLRLSDVRLFSDFITILNYLHSAFVDPLHFVDSFELSHGYSETNADALSIADNLAIQLNAAIQINLSLQDIFTFEDAYNINSVYTDDYIRRYLNDRTIVKGDIMFVHSDSLNLQDEAVWNLAA